MSHAARATEPAVAAQRMPAPIYVDLENGTCLRFTGPAADLLRGFHPEIAHPPVQEPDVHD